MQSIPALFTDVSQSGYIEFTLHFRQTSLEFRFLCLINCRLASTVAASEWSEYDGRQAASVQATEALEQRLEDTARRFRLEAKAMSPGVARDELLRRARQAEAASKLSQWLRSIGRGKSNDVRVVCKSGPDKAPSTFNGRPGSATCWPICHRQRSNDGFHSCDGRSAIRPFQGASSGQEAFPARS